MRTDKAVLIGSAIVGLVFSSSAVWAQDAPPGEALDFLIGDWVGTGWESHRDGSRTSFDVFERVESAAGGQVVLLRGEGFEPAGAGRDGDMVHDAAGFISLTEEGYRLRSATAEGGMIEVPIEIGDSGFNWGLDFPHGRISFEARVEDGVWIESGTWCNTEGNCYPTMEMTLTRTD